MMTIYFCWRPLSRSTGFKQNLPHALLKTSIFRVVVLLEVCQKKGGNTVLEVIFFFCSVTFKNLYASYLKIWRP